jgi:chromosomal replication initiator protein
MTHPMQTKIQAANFWRDHLKARCHAEHNPYKTSRRVLISEIQDLVAEYYDLTRDELLASGRRIRIVRPRQIAMYMCRRFTDKSWPYISRRFGMKDHSTIIHGAKIIGALIETDEIIAAEVAEIADKIANHEA